METLLVSLLNMQIAFIYVCHDHFYFDSESCPPTWRWPPYQPRWWIIVAFLEHNCLMKVLLNIFTSFKIQNRSQTYHSLIIAGCLSLHIRSWNKTVHCTLNFKVRFWCFVQCTNKSKISLQRKTVLLHVHWTIQNFLEYSSNQLNFKAVIMCLKLKGTVKAIDGQT